MKLAEKERINPRLFLVEAYGPFPSLCKPVSHLNNGGPNYIENVSVTVQKPAVLLCTNLCQD